MRTPETHGTMRAPMHALLPQPVLDVLPALILFSLVAFVGSLIAIPVILVKLPANYFDESNRREWFANRHPVLRGTFHVIKNLLGGVFLFAGFVMLFLPGQGILTMLIGVSLVDFPGKRTLERKLIGRPSVLKAINAVREKFGQPPLVVGDSPTTGTRS